MTEISVLEHRLLDNLTKLQAEGARIITVVPYGLEISRYDTKEYKVSYYKVIYE